jgi:hypothetical protein
LIWDEWGRVTRFVESSRYTLMTVAGRFDELQALTPIPGTIEIELPGSRYQVTFAQHSQALSDWWCLHSSCLLLYYALAESAAAAALGCDDLQGFNGVEDWAGRLLERAGTTWASDVDRIGIVEVGVVRNLIAHGERTYTERAVARLNAAGMDPTPRVGDPIRLGLEEFASYRSCLRGLLNRGGLGVSAVEQALRADAASAYADADSD